MPGVFVGEDLSVMALNMAIGVERWVKHKTPLETDRTTTFLNWINKRIVDMKIGSQPELFPKKGPRVFHECNVLFGPLGHVQSQEESSGSTIYPKLIISLERLRKTLSDISNYPEALHIKDEDVQKLKDFLLNLSKSSLAEEAKRSMAIGNHC